MDADTLDAFIAKFVDIHGCICVCIFMCVYSKTEEEDTFFFLKPTPQRRTVTHNHN